MCSWVRCTFGSACCAEKIVSVCLHTGSVSAERVGQEEVGGFTHRVQCTWQLLGLAIKGPWLPLGGPILTLAARISLETLLSPCRGFIHRKDYTKSNL